MTKYKTNEIYTDLSPALKVALSVLEQGLELKTKRLSYSQEKGISWLSKLSRDLKDQVSRANTFFDYILLFFSKLFFSPCY